MQVESSSRSDQENTAPSTTNSMETVDNSNLKFFTLKPIYTVENWANNDWETRISVVVLLPSRTGRSIADHYVEVLPDGKSLKLTVVWPTGMTDPDVMPRIWTDKNNDASKREGAARAAAFQPLLRSLRVDTTKPIESTCNINLPHVVKNDTNLEHSGNIQHIVVQNR